MAEVLAVIGVVASIATFLDIGAKVYARLNDTGAASLRAPNVFRSVADQLPLLTETVKSIEAACQRGHVSEAQQQAIARTLQGCSRQLAQLEVEIQQSFADAKESAWRRRKRTLSILSSQKRTVNILRTLEHYKSTLTLFLSQVQIDKVDGTVEWAHTGLLYEATVPAVRRFIGRNDYIRKIQASYDDVTVGEGETAATTVLLGMGGQGKTQIALEFCKLQKATHSVFWINASSDIAATGDFERIAPLLSSTSAPLSADAAVRQVKTMLSESTVPWLMVFDNYDRPQEFPDIHRFLPSGPKGKILFTTRSADSRRLGHTLDIRAMADEEGAELLMHQSGLRKTPENLQHASEIARLLGGLPLAIDQGGSYISSRNIPLEAFRQHFAERRDVILKHTPTLWAYRKRISDQDEQDRSISAFTTWELSFDDLDDTDKNHFVHALTLAAFMDSTSMSEWFFRAYHHCRATNPPAWLSAFTTDGTWDNYKFQDAIAQLLSVSLVQNMEITPTGTRFSLHPLVSQWLRLRADNAARAAYATEAIELLHAVIESQDDYHMTIRVKHDCLRHMDCGIENEQAFLARTGISKVLFDASIELGNYYKRFDHFNKAHALYERALQAAKGQPKEFDILQSMGELYRAQCKWADGERVYRAALDGKQKILGREDISALQILNSVGILNSRQGKLAEAERIFIQALHGAANLSSSNLITTEDCMDILVLAQSPPRRSSRTGPRPNFRQDDDFTQAFDQHHINSYTNGERGANERILGVGKDGSQTTVEIHDLLILDALNNLGNVYVKASKLKAANHVLRLSLDGKERLLGPDHLLCFDTMANFGVYYLKSGMLDESVSFYTKAIAGKEEILGPEHSSVFDTLNNLGIALSSQGKHEEARKHYNRALAGKKKAYGWPHTLVMDTLSNLGIGQYMQGDHAAARATFEEALEGYDAIELITKRPSQSACDTRHNFGRAYEQLGMFEKAAKVFAAAARDYEAVLGPSHWQVKTSADKARSCAEKAIDQLETDSAIDMERLSLVNSVSSSGDFCKTPLAVSIAELPRTMTI